jgi:glycosyltransferase involved in cell wall biosynthesis
VARPLVTIGISYYNPGRFLRFAIQSVFAQTLQDWQLVLVNDGSTDDSPAFVRSISDSRVLLLGDGCDRGLSARLNQIAAVADSPFLARMDADDIMHPMRLERQLAFMQENSDVDVVGSYAYSIDVDNRPIGLLGDRPMPRSPYEVFVRGCFVHPSVLGKTAWFKSNPYSELYPRAQDVELWARTVGNSTFRCIPEPLLFYRELGISQLKKYLASSAQVRAMVGRGFRGSMSRTQRLQIVAQRYGKALAYRLANTVGLEEWLVRRRSRSLTPQEIRTAGAVLSEILSTGIPVRE